MAVSVDTLTSHAKNINPKGYDVTTTPFTTWITEAIAETLAMASPEFRERAWVDFVGDGAQTRVALPGFDVSLLPINQWSYPRTQNAVQTSASVGAVTPISNPATAPTVALHTAGSTIPSGALLAVAVSWTRPNGRETQLSPFTVIQTTAANQTLDVTANGVPASISTMNVYTTMDITNYTLLGRAATNVATNATQTSLGLGATTATTLPLYNYTDPSTAPLSEGSIADGVVDLEFNEDVTGRAPTDLTAAGTRSVLVLDTAPILGAALRVWYLRTPQLPAVSSTAILGVPDDFLYTGVMAFMYRYLALNHETQSKDQYWQAYLDLHNQLLAMKSNASGRATTEVRMLQWSNQTV